jgi:hypothetical protein
MDDPKITKYERMLQSLPREFRQLAEWGWSRLREDITREAMKAGAEPHLAASMGARLARMVVGQVYQDIALARQLKGETKQ